MNPSQRIVLTCICILNCIENSARSIFYSHPKENPKTSFVSWVGKRPSLSRDLGNNMKSGGLSPKESFFLKKLFFKFKFLNFIDFFRHGWGSDQTNVPDLACWLSGLDIGDAILGEDSDDMWDPPRRCKCELLPEMPLSVSMSSNPLTKFGEVYWSFGFSVLRRVAARPPSPTTKKRSIEHLNFDHPGSIAWG